MSNENSDDILVNIIENNDDIEQDQIDQTTEDASDLLQLEKQKLSECEDKLKHVLADFPLL